MGDGGWGTALALLLAENGRSVTVWSYDPDYVRAILRRRENELYLPGVKLPPEIEWTPDREAAVKGAEIVVLAVPSQFMRGVLTSFAGVFPPGCKFVSVAKGFDRQTRKRMTETVEEILGNVEVAALSGPSHAEEVARGVPTAVCVAARHEQLSKRLQGVFSNSRFRVYTSDDVAGLELGGALKNIIAIAVGMSDGIGFGDNTRAALITRGLAEIARLGCALGAKRGTFAGLSGIGDLIVTCTSKLSRNRAVGERMGRGESVKDILRDMKQVAEGVWNCALARELAREESVEVPITDEVYAIINGGKNPRDAVVSLMTRDLKSEA